MGKLRLEGINGIPLGDAGLLAPIFSYDEGFFQAGDTRGKSFSKEHLLNAFGSGGAFRAQPNKLNKEYAEGEMRSLDMVTFRYALPAIIIYIAKDLLKSFIEKDEVHSLVLQSHGKILKLSSDVTFEHKAFDYYLFKRKDAISFTAKFIEQAAKAIDRELIERLKSLNARENLISGQNDSIYRLAQVMHNLAGAESIYEAVRYKSFSILFGPNAKNFRIWLRSFLTRSDIAKLYLPQSADHWFDAALGLFDNAEMKLKKAMHRRKIGYTATLNYLSGYSHPMIMGSSIKGYLRDLANDHSIVFTQKERIKFDPLAIEITGASQPFLAKQHAKILVEYNKSSLFETQDTDDTPIEEKIEQLYKQPTLEQATRH
ncbi:MAG: hypothetical protein HZB23_03470 [Deltaproteobacteria bacterium]|nr:hypothetical protein [Deltaproteobacteria bacterium]